MVNTTSRAGIGGLIWPACANARQHALQTKAGASIIADGTVREVFRSSRPTVVDYVIQVEVCAVGIRPVAGGSQARSGAGAR